MSTEYTTCPWCGTEFSYDPEQDMPDYPMLGAEVECPNWSCGESFEPGVA